MWLILRFLLNCGQQTLNIAETSKTAVVTCLSKTTVIVRTLQIVSRIEIVHCRQISFRLPQVGPVTTMIITGAMLRACVCLHRVYPVKSCSEKWSNSRSRRCRAQASSGFENKILHSSRKKRGSPLAQKFNKKARDNKPVDRQDGKHR